MPKPRIEVGFEKSVLFTRDGLPRQLLGSGVGSSRSCCGRACDKASRSASKGGREMWAHRSCGAPWLLRSNPAPGDSSFRPSTGSGRDAHASVPADGRLGQRTMRATVRGVYGASDWVRAWGRLRARPIHVPRETSGRSIRLRSVRSALASPVAEFTAPLEKMAFLGLKARTLSCCGIGRWCPKGPSPFGV